MPTLAGFVERDGAGATIGPVGICTVVGVFDVSSGLEERSPRGAEIR
jgi:hypothetical protein